MFYIKYVSKYDIFKSIKCIYLTIQDNVRQYSGPIYETEEQVHNIEDYCFFIGSSGEKNCKATIHLTLVLSLLNDLLYVTFFLIHFNFYATTWGWFMPYDLIKSIRQFLEKSDNSNLRTSRLKWPFLIWSFLFDADQIN